MPRGRVIIIGAIGLLIIAFILILLFGLRGGGGEGDLGGKLEFWGVFDSREVIDGVSAMIPGFEISYRELNPQTYEQELINALAAGRGPDIFMVHNSWLPKHFDKLFPVSAEQLSVGAFRSLYPTVAEQDFAPDGVIFALPLYIDTLALIYNKDIFDSAGIALSPENWITFQSLIPRLRQLDSTGRIVRAAAAIGGSNKNINRAADLLTVLMLQSGVPMVDKDFSRAVFAEEGLGSLNFYTQFANPASEFYTWSDSFLNSIDSFAQESTVMIFNYAHQLPILKQKNPFLNFAVSPLPQPSGAAKKIAYPNYWGLAVSTRAPKPRAAWNYILSFSANPAVAAAYADKTSRLPALRSLISQKLADPALAVFASQALFARSWPQIDSTEIDRIFSEMIDKVIAGRMTAQRAIQEAETKVTGLMERKKQGF